MKIASSTLSVSADQLNPDGHSHDSDGVSEIVISYESYAEPLIELRLGEVIVHDGQGFETVWSGEFEYDATRAARNVPAERRDRFEREIDFESTPCTQTLDITVRPDNGKGRQQSDLVRVTLQEHFSDTRCGAKITVDLKRRVGI